MTDLATIIPAGLAIFGSGWGGQMALAWFNSRNTHENNRITSDVELQKHQDGLTFEILREAKLQVAALTDEVKKLRPMEAHLFHLEQALEHLEAMLNATPDDRPQIERSARAFLNRIRRATEAQGTLANEAQYLASSLNLAQDAKDKHTQTRDSKK